MCLRVWVLREQTRTRKPDGYEVYSIKKPAGIEFRVPVAIPTTSQRIAYRRLKPALQPLVMGLEGVRRLPAARCRREASVWAAHAAGRLHY